MKLLSKIQSLWVGSPLSNLEKLCIQSFIDHGHEFHLYVYDDVDGIPEGAVLKDGNGILPWSELTRGPRRGPDTFSDYFRYALLNQKGGWWMDMDTVCLRPFDFTESVVFADTSDIGCTFPTSPLRFPPGHPLMKTMQELCESRMHMRGLGRTELGGPPLLTEQIHKLQLQHLAQPRMRFFLSNNNESPYFNNTYRDGLHFPAVTHALHLWNTVLVKMGIDKNAQFDAESAFEQLKARHGIAQVAGAKRVTSDEVNALMRDRTSRISKGTRRRKKRERMLQIAVVILAVMLIASHLW